MILRFLRHQLWLRVEQPFATDYLQELEREVLDGCEDLLDVGCGAGAAVQSFTPKLRHSVGVDAFLPAVQQARQRAAHSANVVADIQKLDAIFQPRSFDCVLAFDVIEHMERDQGLRLLAAMETIARKKVIVFTPNGFLPQGAVGGNAYQIHRSGWTVEEMRARGYEVRGIHGIKPILGELSEPKWRPRLLWKSVSVMTQPFVYERPEYAFQIFCVKKIAVQPAAINDPAVMIGQGA